MATGTIPAAQHIAALRYERVHFGVTREHGHRYRLVEVRDFLPAPASFAPADTSVYRRFYAGLLHDMPLCGVKIATIGTDQERRAHLTAALVAYPDPPGTAALLTTVSQRLAGLPPQDERGPGHIAQATALNAVITATTTWLRGNGEDDPGAWHASRQQMNAILQGERAMPQLA